MSTNSPANSFGSLNQHSGRHKLSLVVFGIGSRIGPVAVLCRRKKLLPMLIEGKPTCPVS